MPRGVRGSVDYTAQLRKIDEKIERHASALQLLKQQRQDILSRKQDEDLRDLYAYMQENGMTAAEILAQLTSESSIAASAIPPSECV